MDSRVNRILTKVLPVRAEEATVALLVCLFVPGDDGAQHPQAHHQVEGHRPSGSDNLRTSDGSSVLIGVLMHLRQRCASAAPPARRSVDPVGHYRPARQFWVLLKTEAVWVTTAL
jgi:hypothetical protein